jgi:diguanylate cyclase (GGDEF)-like protein
MAPPVEFARCPEEHVARASQKPSGSASTHTASGDGRRGVAMPDGHLETVLDNAPLVLFAIDPAGMVTICEGSGLAGISPGTASAVVGQSVFDVFANVPEVQGLVSSAMAGNAEEMVIEVEGRYFDTRVSPVLDAAGAVHEVIAVGTDITDRRRGEEALLHQATHDALTGLANRSRFEVLLGEGILRADEEHSIVGVLLMDLIDFRQVNNCYGHAVGDELLRQVAARMAGVVPESAVPARFGGDDFAVLMPDLKLKDAPVVLARRIVDAIQEPFTIHGNVVSLMCSIGIASFPRHAADADTLLRRAEAALETASRSAVGVSVYSREDDQFNPRRLTLLGQLRRAIAEGTLTLHYQPKLSLRTGRVDSVEALVRWPHPEHGMIPPGDFIGLAEQTGLIRPLTVWAIGEALRQAQRFAGNKDDIRIALNLSARDLQDPRLPLAIEKEVGDHGLGCSSLEFELTESAVMADPVRAMDTLQRLSEMGFALSIDDFGTGYSSLSYLQRLPADEVKIDQSFVKDMVHDAYDRAIVRATIDLGHKLHMSVVAEGVEDSATHELLAGMGCDVVQGYQVCRPLPAHELGTWLAERSN